MACLNACTPGFVPTEPVENLEMPLAPGTPNDERLRPLHPQVSLGSRTLMVSEVSPKVASVLMAGPTAMCLHFGDSFNS